MAIIRILLIIIETVCCLLLVGIILMQKSKSEGLGLAFGSGMGESLFGSRTGNVLTKMTIALSVTFLVTTTLLGIVSTTTHETSIIDQRTAPLPVQAAAPPRPEERAKTLGSTAPQSAAPASGLTLMPGASLDDNAPAKATPPPSEPEKAPPAAETPSP